MVISNFNEDERISLGFSPYTYARVAVMKSFLLKKIEYDRLLKMGANEIIRTLQDYQYRKEMDEYDVSSHGLKIIESALNTNLMRSFKKLYSISDKNMKKVISLYLLYYDLENIKTILRCKFAGISVEEAKPLLYTSVNFDENFFKNLLNQERVEDVIALLTFLKKKPDTSSLFEIENSLNKYYYETLSNLSSRLKNQGKSMAKFIKMELDVVNIKTILRLKKNGLTDYSNFLIRPSGMIKSLLNKESIPDMIKYLNKYKFTSLEGKEENLSALLEIDLDVHLLKKKSLLVNQNRLSANYILSYLFAKDIEVKNLKVLVKGKILEITPEYLEKLLVVAS